MNRGPGPLLRWFASLLVRGPGSRFVLGDLDEGISRDLGRGMPIWRARARYLKNLVASSVHLAWARVRLRLPTPPSPGFSWLDVKLGWRALRKHPVLSFVSVLSLAVGIPVGLAPGHVLDAFESPLPVQDGERILGLRYWSLERSGPAPTTTYDLTVWREALTSFEALAAVREIEENLDPGNGVGRPVRGAEITGSAFTVLRARPLLGRALRPEDERAGAPRVVLVGHDVWQGRLAGDPDVIGRTVRVAGVPHTVVGVMPPDFLFPTREQMWLPLRIPLTSESGGGPPVLVFGRLAEGTAAEAAQAELAAVAGRMASDDPARHARLRAEIVPFSAAAGGVPRGGLRSLPAVQLLRVPSLVLLLVACVNVGLLFLARSATRSAEIAVRTALGASRGRIVAQAFTEALVLSVLAAGVGMLLLYGLAERVLHAVWPPDLRSLPYWMDFGMSAKTVAWGLILATVSAAAASVLPALRVTGKGVAGNLQRTRAGGPALRFGGMATALVVADLVVAVAVGGAITGIADKVGGVFGRGNPDALPAEQYLAAEVRLPEVSSLTTAEGDGQARAARIAIVERMLVERLQAEPGVRGVAIGSSLPGTNHSRRYVEVEGRVDAIDRAWVRPGFFDAFGRPVLAGRSFQPHDLEGDRLAVIVNAAFQEEVLAGRNPLGLRLRYPTSGDDPPGYEIVGVAPDLGADPLNPSGGAAVYHPVGPGELAPLRMAIHLGPDPASFTPRLRTLLGEIDPAAILEEPTPLDRVVLQGSGVVVAATAGLSLLSVVLLALAASGIYAIMSHTVAQRTREIGIRAALGARPGRIAATLGRRAAIQLVAGALLGMPLAGWLYFLVRDDPGTARSAVVTAATVPAVSVMLLVGILACTAPLARALRITPTEAMRVE